MSFLIMQKPISASWSEKSWSWGILWEVHQFCTIVDFPRSISHQNQESLTISRHFPDNTASCSPILNTKWKTMVKRHVSEGTAIHETSQKNRKRVLEDLFFLSTQTSTGWSWAQKSFETKWFLMLGFFCVITCSKIQQFCSATTLLKEGASRIFNFCPWARTSVSVCLKLTKYHFWTPENRFFSHLPEIPPILVTENTILKVCVNTSFQAHLKEMYDHVSENSRILAGFALGGMWCLIRTASPFRMWPAARSCFLIPPDHVSRLDPAWEINPLSRWITIKRQNQNDCRRAIACMRLVCVCMRDSCVLPTRLWCFLATKEAFPIKIRK